MQLGLFDAKNRLKKPGMMGDALERVAHAVDWEIFVQSLSLRERARRGGQRSRRQTAYDGITFEQIVVMVWPPLLLNGIQQRAIF